MACRFFHPLSLNLLNEQMMAEGEPFQNIGNPMQQNIWLDPANSGMMCPYRWLRHCLGCRPWRCQRSSGSSGVGRRQSCSASHTMTLFIWSLPATLPGIRGRRAIRDYFDNSPWSSPGGKATEISQPASHHDCSFLMEPTHHSGWAPRERSNHRGHFDGSVWVPGEWWYVKSSLTGLHRLPHTGKLMETHQVTPPVKEAQGVLQAHPP